MEIVEMTTMEEIKDFNHYYQYYHSTPKEAKLDLAPYTDYKFKLLVDDQIIGITAFKWLAPGLAQTGPTILHPHHRGQGYGKLASNLIEKQAESMGARKVCCEVFTFNLPMIVLKLNQGYIIEGTMKDHDTVGLHQYFMSKVL